MTLSDSWIDFSAGWCSGAVAVVAIQPVDTVLTRWQASTVLSSSANNNNYYWSRSMPGGWRALWRGSAPMMGAVPLQNALLMGGYGLGKRYAENDALSNKHWAIFVGGCTGGVLQSFLMSPVELVKVSQQIFTQKSFKETVQTRLTTQPWCGLGATLLRDGIPHGVWFVAYEASKDGLGRYVGHDPVAVPLIAGAIAAAVAWAVGYPADLIKTRIQAGTASAGILGTAQAIVRQGGWTALYRGFGLKLVRSIPASMIGFTTYEIVKAQIERL